MTGDDTTLEPLDRGIPSVNSTRTNPYLRGVVVLLLVLMTCAIAFLAWWQLTPAPDAQAEKPRELTRANTVPARTFEPIPDPEPEPVPAQTAAAAEPRVPAIAPTPILPQTLPEPEPTRPTLDKSRSALMAVARKDNAPAATTAQGGVTARRENAPRQGIGNLLGAPGNGESGSDLSNRLTPTKLTATAASRLPQQSFLLPQGAFIPCALRSRLDSTVTGLTACTVSRDIYSDDGDVLLVDRGSVISGEYRANLAQGQRRIFVLWSRIKTPSGVVIDLDSPATGALGESGVGGQVDTHFWQRFGGALLLSLIDDVAREITDDDDDNGADATAIVIGSTADVSSSLAAEVLRNTINIPPTLYAHHGAEVGVYVARDLDFSTVYDLEALE